MASPALRLRTRWYRALPTDAAGYEEEVLELPRARVGFVGLHCWNIGCPDGPPVDPRYCVGMGWPEAAAEAARIMADVIRPAMDLCRAAGVPVFHVESDWMAAHYPHVPARPAPAPGGPRTHWQQHLLDRCHGPEYLARSPLAAMKRAERVSPVGDEPLVFYSDQLDERLRAAGVEHLIYAGFATDMCILDAEGGARAMLGRGYRPILLRDGTVGVERPDTFAERLATRYGLHRFEWQVGWSTSLVDLRAALGGAP